MAKITILLSTAALAILTMAMGPLLAVATVLITAVLIFTIWNRVQYRLTLKRFSQRIDWVYVVGLPPEKDKIRVGRLEGVVVFCKNSQVGKTTDQYNEIIKESGNKLGIGVLGFRYQDGQRVNENPGEYQVWVVDKIKEHRSQWHEGMKGTSEQQQAWYATYHHRDKGAKFSTREIPRESF